MKRIKGAHWALAICIILLVVVTLDGHDAVIGYFNPVQLEPVAKNTNQTMDDLQYFLSIAPSLPEKIRFMSSPCDNNFFAIVEDQPIWEPADLKIVRYTYEVMVKILNPLAFQEETIAHLRFPLFGRFIPPSCQFTDTCDQPWPLEKEAWRMSFVSAVYSLAYTKQNYVVNGDDYPFKQEARQRLAKGGIWTESHTTSAYYLELMLTPI